MEISRVSLTILWVISLVIPYLVFVIHNSFHRKWIVLFRAITAVCIGWMSTIAYSIAANAINCSLAVTPIEIDALNKGDGTKFAFAAMFGWAWPTIVVGVSWVAYTVVLPKITLLRRSRETF